MNRRRTARWSLPAILLGVVLSGCSDDPAATTAPSSEPTEGGRLVFATNVEPDCLDVAVSGLDITAVVGKHLFDTLLSQAADGTLEPGLAESWEVSDDATTYTFHLRPGVSFSDGSPLDAEAVKFNLDRIVDPETGSQYAVQLLGPYEESEAVDSETLVVRFSRGFSPFLQATSQGFLGIQSPKAIKAGKNPCTDPVGSGPFTLAEFSPQDSVVLEARDDYDWAPATAEHTGRAHLDEVVFKVVPDDQVRAGLLGSGEADVVGALAPTAAERLDGEGYLVKSSTATGAPWSIYLNASRAPYDDPLVRRAVLAAADVDTIVDVLYQGAYPRAWSPLTAATSGYDAGLAESWGNDPELAAQLLDEAGYTETNDDGIRTKDGVPLTLGILAASGTREQRNEAITLLQSQLKEVGIDLTLLPMEKIGELIIGNEFDAIELSFAGGDPGLLSPLFNSANATEGDQIGTNLAQVRDDDIDVALAEGESTLDEEARAAAYAEVQRLVIERGYSLPVYDPVYTIALGSDVGGVSFGAQSDIRFYDAWNAATS